MTAGLRSKAGTCSSRPPRPSCMVTAVRSIAPEHAETQQDSGWALCTASSMALGNGPRCEEHSALLRTSLRTTHMGTQP